MASSAATKDEKAPAAADQKPEIVTDQKPAAALEEDDEFEDFPVDGTLPTLYTTRPEGDASPQHPTPIPQQSAALLTSDDNLDWAAEDTEAATESQGTQHLWEESWDDDDTSDDFSTQLREELKKVEASKKR
ncbi:hypothetical protein B0T16DRAFT_459828 [Cercophora newfieldiana]|uniref:26S proteasome complex subunit SEM1 n=1 Tax=Cercophora newfieldiana TaxID=92897 RepID=A0AA40CMD0_9PEZI|nr:hypothetical protein B0T16DRAFT_459828 [Cercophora newfieldiana]